MQFNFIVSVCSHRSEYGAEMFSTDADYLITYALDCEIKLSCNVVFCKKGKLTRFMSLDETCTKIH